MNAIKVWFQGYTLFFFCVELLQKKHTVLLVMMILGNHCLGTSLYKFALGAYEIVYRQLPNDYLICLCMAVTYANLAAQKFSVHKTTLAIDPGDSKINYGISRTV